MSVQIPLNFTGYRLRLTADTTFYVATTGSNSNPGTSASPWLTIQYAWDYIAGNIDLAGFIATIQVADGTYTGWNTLTGKPNGIVKVIGNRTTPANVTISTLVPIEPGGSNRAGIAIIGCPYEVRFFGFKVTCSGANDINVYVDNCKLVTYADIYTVANGGVGYLTAGSNVNGYDFSTVVTFTAEGTYRYLFQVFGCSFLDYEPDNLVLVAGTNWTSACVNCSDTSTAQWAPFSSISGTATGKRYNAVLNGVINTFGGGATFIPGDVAGTTATGGQYV